MIKKKGLLKSDIDYICEGVRQALYNVENLDYALVMGVITQRRLTKIDLIPQSQRAIKINVPHATVQQAVEGTL